MAWEGEDGSARLYSGSLHERWQRARIGATIFCLRMGFWLASCASAVLDGAKVHLLKRVAGCTVKDQDSLVSQ